jgi:lysophospholipase L1-like esterase
MKIAAGSRLLFIGDSVTDCGRARPIGTGSGTALGDGYVAQIGAALGPIHPNNPIQLINMGISGNTVRDLAARWDGDVLALKPDWLSIMIGINDVWRQFDGIDHPAAVMADEFERTFENLVARTQPLLKGLVLMTPYYVQLLRTDPIRRRMDAYGAVTRKLAARHGVLLVDTQGEFDHAMEANAFRKLADDRVHPTTLGHAILARAFLRAIDVNPHSPR